MHLIENLDIKFDTRNPNAIIIRNKENNKIINVLACPPIDCGCDVIAFGETLCEGYTFNFKGFVLITTPEKRELYHKGNLIAETKRLGLSEKSIVFL